jgi:hypothetical protein
METLMPSGDAAYGSAGLGYFGNLRGLTQPKVNLGEQRCDCLVERVTVHWLLSFWPDSDALLPRDVERILDHLVAKIGGIGSRCDRVRIQGGSLLRQGAPRFRRRLAWRLSDYQIPQQLEGIGTNGAHNRHELDHVDAALAALVFGDKGLGTLQSACQLMLGQAGLLAGSHHQGAEGGLI